MAAPAGSAFDTRFGGYRLVFGPGTFEHVGALVRECGVTRALVVTDPNLHRAGHVERALAALRAAGVEAAVFDGVEQNPTSRHVAHGVAVAREVRIDGLVGLGGGSALDCAKGINFVLTGGGTMEDYRGWGKARQPMLPAVGVPTTAGTGSEAQSYALIAEPATQRKMACGDPGAMFRAVILDPRLVPGLPRPVAAAAGLDAVAHAVESHVSRRANPISRQLSREAFRLLDAALPAALARPDAEASWGPMLLGAHLAGAAIEGAMLGAAHALANPLTARFPLDHGTAVALMLPHVVRFNASVAGDLYAELSGDLEPRLRVLRRVAGLPERLADCGVPRGELGHLAVEAAEQWTAGFNPRPVTQADLLGLYEAAHEDRA